MDRREQSDASVAVSIVMKKMSILGVDFEVCYDTHNSSFWGMPGWGTMEYIEIYNYFVEHRGVSFVDLGAWIGPMTLFAAKLYDKVYAVEPDPRAFDELKANVKLNGFSNVEMIQKAVFDSSKTEIIIGDNYGDFGDSGTSIFQAKNAISVPCITLREIFSTYNIPKHSLIKMDVEGSEYCLFDDIDFFEIYKPVIWVEFHFEQMKDNAKQLENALKKLSRFYHSPDVDVFINSKCVQHCKIYPYENCSVPLS